MAPRDQNDSNLRQKTAEQEVEVPLERQKPASPMRVVMHVFWIAALFMVFKGISMYVEDRREDAAAVEPSATAPAIPATPAPAASSQIPDASPAPATSSPVPTAAAESPRPAAAVPAAAALPADVTPAMSGKTITKATTCPELKDVLEYWTDVAKKPRSEARGKWLEERIQDVQAQKSALNCT